MIAWGPVLERAAAIVESYDTGVTLRQLFYRLVAAEILPNTDTSYKGLSARTAEARRNGRFPALVDRVRTIQRYQSCDGPKEALDWLVRVYRRDRTEGQDVSVYVGVEKAGLVALLENWFADLGIPILALGGYASQSYVNNVVADVEGQDRPAVLLYAGDFDPSGEDIDRDFLARTDCFVKVVRVALNAEQVEAFHLPPQPGKASDSRASSFVDRHGTLVQVELDALPPDVLRDQYRSALDELWEMSAFEAVMKREDEERALLSRYHA